MDECVKACCVGCIEGVCIACCVTMFELCREIVCRPLCERCCNGCFDACLCCDGAKRKPRSYSSEDDGVQPHNGASGGATYDPPVVTVVPMNVQPLTTVAVNNNGNGAYADLPTAYAASADSAYNNSDVPYAAPVNHEMDRDVS